MAFSRWVCTGFPEIAIAMSPGGLTGAGASPSGWCTHTAVGRRPQFPTCGTLHKAARGSPQQGSQVLPKQVVQE